MRRPTLVVAYLVVAFVAPGPRPATAGPVDARIVAGPGGYVSVGNYYTPVVVTPTGGRVTFGNYDIEPHNVVSTKKIGRGRRARPLFASRLLDFNESAPVAGVRKLEPGTYEFYCTLHPWMRGTLVVQSAPATPRAVGAR